MNYLSDKNWIEKSKTLIYAEWSKFDIHELQIFETYLSRIDPRNVDSSCVRFTKSEYARLMGYAGTTSVKTKTLDKWIKNFMKKQITINYGDGDKRHVNLFSDASVHKDKDTGEIVVDLDCNTKLKPVFFNIAETGYISYRRRNTLDFKSQYTLKLYCMLKDHAWGDMEWIVDLKSLRNSLGAVEPLYEKFPEFNRRILKKAESEINGNTDISFTYEKITRGKLTRGIKFKIEKNEEIIKKGEEVKYKEKEKIIDIDKSEIIEIKEENQAKKEESYFNERQKKIIENIRTNIVDMNPNWSITDEQALELNDMIHDRVFKNSDNPFTDDLELKKTELLIKLLRRARSGKAKIIYNWLISMWNIIIDDVDRQDN